MMSRAINFKRIGNFDSAREAKQLVRAVERMTLDRAPSPNALSLGGSDIEVEFTRVHSKDFDDSDDSEGSESPRQRTHSEPLLTSMDLEPSPKSLPKRVVQLRSDASRRHDEKIVSFATTKLMRRLSRRRDLKRAVEVKNGYSAGCECEDDEETDRVMCAYCIRAEKAA